jgi:hypothetical protein
MKLFCRLAALKHTKQTMAYAFLFWALLINLKNSQFLKKLGAETALSQIQNDL